MRQIRALVAKDLRIHARSIGVRLLGWFVVMRILAQVQHAMGLTRGQSLAVLVTSASIPLFPIFAVYSAQWLIERERGKETFAWIRTLPVSDAHIVLAKFAASLAICLIVAIGWRIAVLGIDIGLASWQLVSAFLLWCAFAGIALLCQVLFSGRLAGVAPGLLFFLATGVALLAGRSPDAVAGVAQRWNDPHAHVLLWLACMAVEACAVAAAYARFHAVDSQTLVE